MKIKQLILASLMVIGLSSHVQATSSWPDKPVTVVVPYSAGGGTDTVARLLAQELSELWGQPVMIANREGASGTIGAAYVARSKPDGNTIMLSAPAEVAISQHIMPKLPYDPETDLQPITLAVKLPFLLVANPNKPYKTTAELIEYAGQHPGEVTYASSGNGTPQHLAAALFEQLSGTTMLHVPYKGVAPSINALLADQIDVAFVGLPIGYSHAKAGALHPLAVSSVTRSPAMPDVPTVAETKGVEAFDLTQWFGVFAPANTPDEIIHKIQQDIATVLQYPALRATLEEQGAEPNGMPTAEFEQFVKNEREKFGKIVEIEEL